MPTKTQWDQPGRTEWLMQLIDQGLSKREIAATMGTTLNSINMKLVNAQISVALGVAMAGGHRPQFEFAPGKEPHYDDITPAEARRIAATAPPCGRWRKGAGDVRYSPTGCAAAMCTR